MTDKKKRRTFTREFKAETVKLVLEGKRPIALVAKDLGITETSVRSCVSRALIDMG